jgi:hypothetical protein
MARKLDDPPLPGERGHMGLSGSRLLFALFPQRWEPGPARCQPKTHLDAGQSFS